MKKGLAAEESRMMEFFDAMERMFGPNAQDPPQAMKDSIFAQVYRVRPSVMGPEPKYRMTEGILNALLSAYQLPATVNESFIGSFFRAPGGADQQAELSIEDLRQRVKLFVKVAHWGFGSYLRAFQSLGSVSNIPGLLEDFPLEELQHSEKRKVMLRTTSPLRLQTLALAERAGLGYAMRKERDTDLKDARKKAIENSHAYLVCEDVDIYLAGSMRPGEFDDLVEFSQHLRSHFYEKGWNPTIFDPTICWYPAPTDKGLLEALMVKRAHIGVMLAGETDTFGKDAEVAHLLAQGKPVVMLFPDPDRIDEKPRRDRLWSRFQLYQNIHPLRLQVSPMNGVAYGIIAVRDEKLCFEIIDDLLQHSLRTDVNFSYAAVAEENEDIKGDAHRVDATALVEGKTGSVLRVITKDPFLTQAFWNRYFEKPVPAETFQAGQKAVRS